MNNKFKISYNLVKNYYCETLVILPKCCEEKRTSEEDDQLCIAVHKTYTYLNAVKSPLDTSGRNNSTALPYITIMTTQLKW